MHGTAIGNDKAVASAIVANVKILGVPHRSPARHQNRVVTALGEKANIGATDTGYGSPVADNHAIARTVETDKDATATSPNRRIAGDPYQVVAATGLIAH